MSAEITGIMKHSPAFRAGIRKGDVLVSVNGHEINDVLDYMFYCAEDRLVLVCERKGERFEQIVLKSEFDDLGLEFQSFLMDSKRSCSNKCVFCFIDQLPKGMRETLYFKDDDARLSFLQGNYVTLTNLTDKDIERIIEMRLNINVSVHTTNPELRCMMMHNRFAGEKLRYLKMIADSGLMMNCQIVCCPELNDGDELRRTLNDLEALMPSIQSVAVVPVGVTKFRNGLYPLRPFTGPEAADVIDIIAEKQALCLEKWDTRMVFPADEFFLLAGRELPDGSYYEDYPQYENGVGLLRSLRDEVEQALEDAPESVPPRVITLATGTAAEAFHKELAALIMKRYPSLDIRVVGIVNNFFGETITVAGLVTGGDLIEQLRGRELGEELLIPRVMLKADEPVFLDDLCVSDVERELDIKVTAVRNDGFEYLDSILGVGEE
ncbi:MAG: DUF512 domain-containing protein [Ruminococcus sp.]|nr:DUF512 domain-containing protein [Ruminococcus sp.]